jgi:hypothetical protein
MNHILALAFMGLLAGALAGLWTRIIKKGMVFNFVHVFLTRIDQDHILKTGFGSDAPLSTFLRCVFCLTPWLAFVLDICYVVIYTPAWYLCIIGVLASLGAGNMIAEIIYRLRHENL